MSKNIPSILNIGPLPPGGHGIVSYITGLVNSPLKDKYDFIFLNTRVPRFFKRFRKTRFVLSFIFFVKLLLKLIFYRFEIVHVHSSSAFSFWEKSFLAIVCRFTGKIIIFHIHGGNFIDYYDRSNKRHLILRVLNKMNKVIVLSELWKKHFISEINSNILTLIPNAISTDSFLPQTISPSNCKTPVKLLYIGTINIAKGLIDLAKALEILVAKDFRFFLNIVGGEINRREYLKINSFFTDLNLDSHIKFHGSLYTNDKIEKYHESDIFILPSHQESFGLVNLEAMASGLPVISTNVGAIPDYLKNGENGFLFEPGDYKQLALSLENLILNPQLRIEMGIRNLEAVKKYDWLQIEPKIDFLYQSLLKS